MLPLLRDIDPERVVDDALEDRNKTAIAQVTEEVAANFGAAQNLDFGNVGQADLAPGGWREGQGAKQEESAEAKR